MWTGVVLGVLLIVAACTPTPAAPATEPAEAVPQSCKNIAIDWVNFIKLDGITYLAEGYRGGREPVDEDLGPQYAKVTFGVAGNVCESGYKSKRGDAAYLEPGTPVHIP